MRPTFFGSTPTFWNYLYREYNWRVHKLTQSQHDHQSTIQKAKHQVLQEMKSEHILGNRLQAIVCGGSPSHPSTLQFLSDLFDTSVVGGPRISVADGYALTEVGTVLVNGRVPEGSEVDIVLIDALDFGYSIKDEPNPRGEICVHSPTISPGYYGNPDLNAKCFIECMTVPVG